MTKYKMPKMVKYEEMTELMWELLFYRLTYNYCVGYKFTQKEWDRHCKSIHYALAIVNGNRSEELYNMIMDLN